MFSKVLSLTAMCTLLTSCAALFNDSSERVSFVGAPSKGKTVISTPMGELVANNGAVVSTIMERSRKDVPVSVTCPDGSKKDFKLETEFDVLVGGVVNLLNFPLGWIVDPFSDRAYTYSDVNLGAYCGGNTATKPTEFARR